MPDATYAAEAADALRGFLAGFGIGPGHDRERLVERLLPAACAGAHAAEDPCACAILYAEQAFESWLIAVLGAERLAGQPALPIGRAAFLACDGPARWSEVILVEAVPETFVAAMRAAAPLLAPMPAPGTMAAQSLEAWSIADAGRALAGVLDANRSWLGQARPLITVPIKLGRPGS